MKKKSISLNEIGRKLGPDPKSQIGIKNNKMTVKTSGKEGPDFLLNNIHLPVNHHIHILSLNLSIPIKSNLSIEIICAKTGRLLNEKYIKCSQANVPMNYEVYFYSEDSVKVSFQLQDGEIEAGGGVRSNIYYIFRIGLESYQEENYPDFRGDVKKFKAGTLSQLEKHPVFDLVKNSNPGDRDTYIRLLCDWILKGDDTTDKLYVAYYNIMFYSKNNGDSKKTRADAVEINPNLEEVMSAYKGLNKEKTDLHDKQYVINEELEEYKTQYTQIYEELSKIAVNSENFEGKKSALAKSDFELGRLESLRSNLLKELGRLKKYKQILQDGVDLSPVCSLIDLLYSELGCDAILIDRKIREYIEVLECFKKHYEEDELTQLITKLEKEGSDIVKEVEKRKKEKIEISCRLLEIKKELQTNLRHFIVAKCNE